ncbi:unnamed protein product [Adineta ricciae]|uniref:Uncharacterized protein n=1 Tax=Adineta ricciae TaxID=249248 RepID=A0A816FMW8_ADIRI|nr:unnamed protein product [Adineta ricciae]
MQNDETYTSQKFQRYPNNDQCNPLAYADEMNCLNLLKGVLERNNCLTSLHFHGWPSAILNFSQCDIKSVSIFELNLRSSAGFDFYYTAQQCDQLSCSTLGMQCRILTIGVKDRTCVYDLIMKMNSLQILNVPAGSLPPDSGWNCTGNIRSVPDRFQLEVCRKRLGNDWNLRLNFQPESGAKEMVEKRT